MQSGPKNNWTADHFLPEGWLASFHQLMGGYLIHIYFIYFYIPQSKDINIMTDNIADSCKLMHGTSFSNWWTVQDLFSNFQKLGI